MNQIWKYRLSGNSPVTKELPQGARILSVSNDEGIVAIHVLCDTSRPSGPARFSVVGESATLRDEDITGDYVGHARMEHGMVHVFKLHGGAP